MLSYEAKSAATSIGRGLRQARQRRRDSQEVAAQRVGVAVSTWRRMEAGDPSVAWGVMLDALVKYGFESQVFALGDPALDAEGQLLDRKNLPQRIRSRSAQIPGLTMTAGAAVDKHQEGQG
jgi:transcriptional regulator with XRE-family HTH domain